MEKKRKKKKKEITFEISEGKKSKLVVDSSKDTKNWVPFGEVVVGLDILSSFLWVID